MNNAKPRATRPNNDQKLLMVQFLENHIEMANDKYESSADGAEQRIQQWNKLAVELNKLNGANKSGEKWRKYWQDQRLYVKDRYTLINPTRKRSGAHATLKELSDYEKRASVLCSRISIGNGEVIEIDCDEMSTIKPVLPFPLQKRSAKKRTRPISGDDKRFNKYLEFEEKKFLLGNQYKCQKLNLMENIAKKQIEIEESKIEAINSLREAIKNINK